MGRRLRVATVITRMTAGAGGVALRGALALNPAEYEVTVIAGGAGLDGASAYDGAAEVLVGHEAVRGAPTGDLLAVAAAAGLEVKRVPSLVSAISPRRDRAALRVLTSLIGQGGYDVVHTHSAKAGALGRLAGYRAGVPRVVHTYHGFPFHDYQSAARRGLYVQLERWLGQRTDAVLAVGPAVAADTARLRLISPERIVTIAPAIDPVSYPGGTSARGVARRRLELAPGVRVVGTIGRVDYQKAPEQWIDAFAALATDDIWGVWVGDGPLRDKLLARARRKGVADRFLFMGHRDDATALLPAFDVFLLASRYEGLPCVLAEAMQARVPIVATGVNSVQDLVVPGVTGLLVARDEPVLLARAAAHLLDNPMVAARMANAAHDSLGDRFTPRTLGAFLERSYQGDTPRRTTASDPAPRLRRSVQWT